MDHSGNQALALRRRSTIEVIDGDKGNVRRHSSRAHAIASVRKITKLLSKKPSTTSITNNDHATKAKSLSIRHGSIGKQNETSMRQISINQAMLSKKKSSSSEDGLHTHLSKGRSHSLTKQSSKEANKGAKEALISRLSKQKSSRSFKNGVELWFERGSFVATRAPDGERDKYYICIILKDVYNFTKKAKVRWLDRAHSRPLESIKYKMKYLDTIDPACILLETNVNRLSRLFYELTHEEHNEIMKIIKTVEDFESGKLAVNDLDDVQKVIQVDEPPKKKPKHSKAVSKKDGAPRPLKEKVKLVKTASQKLRDKAMKSSKKKENGEKKSRKKKVDEPKRKKATASNDLQLSPRPDVKVLEKDTLFETRAPMPYISKSANSRLIFRAIYLEDEKLLKKLLKDKDKIFKLYSKSVNFKVKPYYAALQTKNVEIFKILLHELCGEKFKDRKVNNFNNEETKWHKLGTGSYNQRSLGVSRILKLQASRGSKEGNNAFLKSESVLDDCYSIEEIYYDLMDEHHEIPDDFLKEMQILYKRDTIDEFYNCIAEREYFIPLLLKGHNKAAGNIACHFSNYHSSFNELMREVLVLETEELSGCAPSAVRFVSKRFEKLTPYHLAAVNPNSQYLERILSVDPLVHVTDGRGRRPIHFAACCSSPANLKLLIKWGSFINETCHNRRIPLYYAIRAGRPENVKFLLQRASEDEESDPLFEKFGAAGVNRPFSNGKSLLHKAVKQGNIEIVKLLLSYGASVNAKTSVGSMQITPLMKAASTGNLEIVKLLIEHGAVVEQKDRLGRTALIHACMDGALKVLSYLVHIGSNPERPDSSDNYPIHYASAYGWYFTVQFLVEIGVDINVRNMWKFSPISVAFLKGHVGIVRELLMNEKVDINQTMEDGTSLIFQACESDLCQDDLYDQIEYLIKEKGALCDIKDVNGKTALFHLTNAPIGDDEKIKDAEKQSIKIANLLIDNGCDLNAVDSDGFTASMEALSYLDNLALAEVLLKKGCKVFCPPKVGEDVKPKDSLLYRIITKRFKREGKAIKSLELMIKYKYHLELQQMANCINANGYPPLITFASGDGGNDDLFDGRPASFKTQEEEKAWNDVVLLFKFLVTKCHADVNARVVEKFLTLEERLSATDFLQKYDDNHSGGKNCLHYFILEDPRFDLAEQAEKSTRASSLCKFLVKHGAELDNHDMFGKTPLATALENEFVSAVTYLAEEAKCNVNLPVIVMSRGTIKATGVQELPHFIYLHEKRQAHEIPNALKLFSTLIDSGIDVNARSQMDDHKHGTFLHILLQKMNMNRSDMAMIVEKLLKTSFDFEAQDDKGKTVMHYALRSNKNELNDCFELENKLLTKCSLKIKDYKQRTPLHYILKKKSPRYRDNTRDPSHLLRLACQRADKMVFNEQDRYGKSLLHLAAEKNYIVCIYLLTKNKDKVNIHLKDKDGNTPLSLAVQHGNESCALALLQCGASLKDDVMILSEAEKAKRKKEMKEKPKEDEMPKKQWILKTFKNVKTDPDVTKMPFYKVAINKDMQGIILQLIDAPEDKSGLAPKDMIQMALECGRYNIALQIMHANCNSPKMLKHLTTCDEKGRNLLHLLPLSILKAPNEGYNTMIKIANLLHSFGISSNIVDVYGCSPTQYAILNRHFQLADVLAENGSGYDVNKKDKFGRGILAALFWRIHSKGIDNNAMDFLKKMVIKKLDLDVLIDLPLNPDVLDVKSQDMSIEDMDSDYWQSYLGCKTTPLIAAIVCSKFDSDLSRNLLLWDANPNKPDANNISPLMHAVIQNKTDFVRQLLHFDYDPNAVEEEKKPEDKKKGKKANTSIFRLKKSSESEESSEEESDTESEKEKEKKEQEALAKEYKPVKKTSSVKMDQKDNNGRTALHYASSQSPLGTFDNAELAFVLIKGGAKSTADKFGFTPFTLAVETCALNVIEKLTELGHGSKKNSVIQHNYNFPVNDGVDFNWRPNFMKDADKVLRRHDSGMEVDDLYVHEVDEMCNVPNGKLMKDKDKEIDVWFDVLMTKVDVKRYPWGLYNFYKLQLVYEPAKKLYILFTRWGRIGDEGQYQHTPFEDEAAAVKEFAKIFREKSGNKWKDFKQYERNPKKYRLLEDMARKAPPQQKRVELDLETEVATALPQHLFSLIQRLMSPNVMEYLMKNMKCMNTESLPFGQLNKERLMQGKQLLERIQKCIEVVKELKPHKRAEVPQNKIEELHKNCELISELSNEYFHVIPQVNFSCEKCEPLNENTIIQHLYFINNMLNYEIISKMLLAAMTHKNNINPVDFVYRCLGCKVELMDQEDSMSQLILKYINASSNCKVFGIYKLSREGEEERLKATKLGNHRLMWHGTHPTNILSILTRGMLVAPPEAQHNAWAYGKGIYFADEFCKSNNYVRDSTRSFMLLCQVALGNCVPFEESKEPKNSTIVNKRVNEDFTWMTLNSGIKIPYDNVASSSSWFRRSREYIVENPAQICLRYLIEYDK